MQRPEDQLQLLSAAGEEGPVAVGDALLPTGVGWTGLGIGPAVVALVVLVAVGRVREHSVLRRTRDCEEGSGQVSCPALN